MIRGLIPCVLAAVLLNSCTDSSSSVSVDDGRRSSDDHVSMTGLVDMGDYYLFQVDIMLRKDAPELRAFVQKLYSNTVSGNNDKTASAYASDVQF